MELIPPELSMLSATGLVALSFFASMLTAAIGIGGGLLMLTVMVSFLPPFVVLPVHGVIQLGSNGGRMALVKPDARRNSLHDSAANQKKRNWSGTGAPATVTRSTGLCLNPQVADAAAPQHRSAVMPPGPGAPGRC